MRKSILSITVLLVLCFSSLAVSNVLYISPDGNDQNPGTKDKPFATFDKAKQAVAGLNLKGLDSDVTVYVRQGQYKLDKPIVFNADHGGSFEYSVTYKAYPNETPVLTGGIEITAWKKQANGIWTAKLPDSVEVIRNLYLDGKRLDRGRYPEKGFMKINTRSDDFMRFTFDTKLPDIDYQGKGVEFVVIQNWSISRQIIKSRNDDTLNAATAMGWIGHGHCIPKPRMNCYLENSPAFITKDHQWAIDHESQTVYYKSPQGSNPNEQTFIAPVTENLMKFQGTKDAPVRNLHVDGFEFVYAAWKMPDIGYRGIQAGYYGTSTEEIVSFSVTPAIDMIYTQDSAIKNSKMKHFGGNSVAIGAGCDRNRVVGCEIADIGCNGPMVGYMAIRDPLWADWKDPKDVPNGNEISNCYIHHCGIDFFGAVGVFDAMADGTKIVHNELVHLPYGGISIGYVWNTELTSQKNCYVAYNHVYEVMEKLYDSGAIYTLGYQPGTILQGNHLHAVRRSGFAFGSAGNNGIFFDEGSTGYLLKDNVIYDIYNTPTDSEAYRKRFCQPIRYNNCKQEWHTWRNNYINVSPKDIAFPWDIAGKAGLEPQYRHLLK